MTKRTKSAVLVRRVVLLGAAAVLVSVLIWLGFAGGENETGAGPERPPRTVTVVETSATRHAAEIVGLAEVRPRWTSTLRARVGGVLSKVSDDLQPGARVDAGELLVTIDRTPWLANLAEAESRLVFAELELVRERAEADEARDSWRASGLPGEPASGLVLRGPQIEAAEVQVETARAARDWAERQLDFTQIRAPFAGLVAQRYVSRGESILEGEAVAQIVATEVFELALQVSEIQWRRLAAPVVGTAAELVAPEGTGRWRAEVVRVGGSIDETTRMRTLHLAVTDPLASEVPLLPGSFVRVHLRGDALDRVLELPEGVLTRGGHIWYVDEDDTLRRFSTEPLFTRPGRLYVAEPRQASGWRIVRHPLDSFMVGQAVRPERDTRTVEES
ncbi:MAG: efflux RND transporter periplasmic adaptor subunit [Acidobacteriota bacterium]